MREPQNIVHCISLKHREDRKELFRKQAREHGFEYKFWEGIVIEQLPFSGISKSHKQIVRYAKAARLPYVIIAEDDLKITARGGFKHYINNRPNRYDIYFGGCYDVEVNESGKMIRGFSGMTLYTVHERFYDTFLGVTEMDNIDRRLGFLCYKYDFYICQPEVCYQLNGVSDHKGKYASYDHLLEGKKLYGVKS